MKSHEWAQLEHLCRRALDTIPEEKQDHPIADAIRTTGAFAASVQVHDKEGSNG
jgi:hypothetical protein